MLDLPTPLHVAFVAGGDGCVGRVQMAGACQTMQMAQMFGLKHVIHGRCTELSVATDERNACTLLC